MFGRFYSAKNSVKKGMPAKTKPAQSSLSQVRSSHVASTSSSVLWNYFLMTISSLWLAIGKPKRSLLSLNSQYKKKKSHPKLPHWSQAVMWKEHVSKEIVQAPFLSVFKTQLDIPRVTWSDLMDGTAFSPHSFCTRLHWIPHHIPA